MKATCVISVFIVLSFEFIVRRMLFNLELSCGGIVSQPEERCGAKVITYFVNLLFPEERHGTQSFMKWKVVTDTDIIIMEILKFDP
jgi:hypothetical protein